MRSLLVWLILAGAALAADCDNCQGDRLVGPGPMHYPCPVCCGSGTVADPPPAPPPPPAGAVCRASADVVAAVESAPAAPARGRPRPVVCRIAAADGPSRIYGSGVLVQASGSTGIVLTNWHVARTHRQGIMVSWPDGTTSKGTVVAWDDAWDLAALAVVRPKAAPVTIAATAPRLGDQITIAGYGPGKYLEQTGPVTDYLSPTKSHPRQFVEMKGTARQGDSGGPMFNAEGELAGVLFGEREGRTIGSCSTRVAVFLSTVAGPRAACSVCEASR